MANTAFNSLKAFDTLDLRTVLFVLLAILIGNVGLIVFKRLRFKVEKNENTVGGIFFSAVSVLYSLILAFVLMAEWDDFNDLNKTIMPESDKLNGILAHSANLPDSLKSTISQSLADYCIQVIDLEWAMQEPGTINHPSAIPAMRSMLLSTMPANALEANSLKVIDDNLSAITDLRRNRLHHTRSQLPPLIWNLLEVGAVLLVSFTYFFQVHSARRQHIYVSFVVCLLAMCLSVIYNLDHPFITGSGLQNEPYQNILSELPYNDASNEDMTYLRYWQGR